MNCTLKRNRKKAICIRLRKMPKKDLNWKQAKMLYPKLKANGNADKDSKKNSKDCHPFDKKRQDDANPYASYDLLVSPKTYKAFEIIRYGRDMGLSPRETHNELKEKGYSGDEMREASRLYNESERGKRIGSYYE